MTRLLFFGNDLGHGDQYLYREQPDAVLIIAGESLEQGNHLLDDDRGRHSLDKLGEIVCRLATDHGRVIVNQLSKLLSENFLRRTARLCVGCVIQPGGRDFRREPVGF